MSRQTTSRLAVVVALCGAVLVPWALMGIGPSSVASGARPSSYNDFVSVDTFPTVEDAIQSGQYLYFPPGNYFLNNPVVIDRTTSLFMHGSGYANDVQGTRVFATDPTQPMFIVQDAPLISVAGMHLWPGGTDLDARVFHFQNSAPTEFELMDSLVRRGVIEIQGPGSFRIQGVTLQPSAWVGSPLIVDHPQADVLMVGGNINNFPNATPLIQGIDRYHVWQKQGRFRIYGTGVQWAQGPADFRIDTASPTGPHVIANVRSEGSNSGDPLAFPSAFLHVPASTEAVDVVVMNNSGSWEQSGHGASYMVDYNATGAGTLWLVGNHSVLGAGALVIGNAPNSAIVALANRLYDDADILPVVASSKIFAGNTWSYAYRTGDQTQPRSRFVNPSVNLADYPSVPPVPQVAVPLPLERLPVLSALPGMLSAATFGAVGDGTTDDTAALQAWLDAGKLLFLPAGTYRTTDALG